MNALKDLNQKNIEHAETTMKMITKNIKNISIALSLLFSAQAFAEQMSPSELARRGSCTKEQCFKNDGGKDFLHSCEFQMMNYPPNITVIGPLWVNNHPCYCPCTLEYMAGAVRD